MAVIVVHLSRDGRSTSPFEAVVDSGSSVCLFHADIARDLGIRDITKGKAGSAGGVAEDARIRMFAHEVELHFDGASATITAHFSEDLPVPALLGRQGFLDRYIVRFDPDGFEITPYTGRRQYSRAGR